MFLKDQFNSVYPFSGFTDDIFDLFSNKWLENMNINAQNKGDKFDSDNDNDDQMIIDMRDTIKSGG